MAAQLCRRRSLLRVLQQKEEEEKEKGPSLEAEERWVVRHVEEQLKAHYGNKITP